MSIRLLALALYESMQKEKELEEKLNQPNGSQKDKLEQEMKKVRLETEQLRNIIDGKKKPED